MPPAPPARRTAKATPPADDATVVVTFKGRKNAERVTITLVKHKDKWASHAYCPEELQGHRAAAADFISLPEKIAGRRARKKVLGRRPARAPAAPAEGGHAENSGGRGGAPVVPQPARGRRPRGALVLLLELIGLVAPVATGRAAVGVGPRRADLGVCATIDPVAGCRRRSTLHVDDDNKRCSGRRTGSTSSSAASSSRRSPSARRRRGGRGAAPLPALPLVRRRARRPERRRRRRPRPRRPDCGPPPAGARRPSCCRCGRRPAASPSSPRARHAGGGRAAGGGAGAPPRPRAPRKRGLDVCIEVDGAAAAGEPPLASKGARAAAARRRARRVRRRRRLGGIVARAAKRAVRRSSRPGSSPSPFSSSRRRRRWGTGGGADCTLANLQAPSSARAAGGPSPRRVPTPRRAARGGCRSCARSALHQQHKPSEYACFLKQRGFEAGASYSGGTASGIVEK